MMDIKCKWCGEPWDIDELHEEAQSRNSVTPESATFDLIRQEFYRFGCGAITYANKAPGVCPDARVGANGKPQANPMLEALQELSGGDVDGLASDLDDLEFLGMLE